MIKVKNIKIFFLKYSLEKIIKTSFGNMKSRPCIIITIEDYEQNFGLGEVWCNFPEQGAQYRFQILNEMIPNLLIDNTFESPEEVNKYLEVKIKTIFLQSGDKGTYHNILSGIDCAVWDLFAKSQQKPLNKFINNDSKSYVDVYASGISPEEAFEKINIARSLGIKSFKIKIGFNNNLNKKLIKELDNSIKENEFYMVDVNQGWGFEDAIIYLKQLESSKVKWVEEPISSDISNNKINELANYSNCNLAFGENITNIYDFINISRNSKIKFIQPDITKFGGISLINELKNKIDSNKIWLHFLGGGVGLVASAHLQSSINNQAFLEMDINNNPLRENIFKEKVQIIDGKINLNNRPGLGFELNYDVIYQYLVSSNI